LKDTLSNFPTNGGSRTNVQLLIVHFGSDVVELLAKLSY